MNGDLLNTDNTIEENSINIKKEFSYYFFFWPWILVITLFTLMSSFIYLRYTERIYESNAQLQVKDKKSDPTTFLTEGVNGIFDFDRINLSNDMAVIKSHNILAKIVDKLDLQTNIYGLGSIVGEINTRLLYKPLVPIDIEFKDVNNDQEWNLEVYNNTLKISNDELTYTIKKGEELDEKELFIRPKDSLFLRNKQYKLTYNTLNNAVARISSNLTVKASSKRGEIIDLSIQGPNIQQNQAILNTLIQVLEQDQVDDKREIFEISIEFIEERLKGLTKNIDNISKKTINFQMENSIYNSETQTGNALNNILKGEEEVLRLRIQLEITNALLEKLKNQSGNEVLPSNIGVENTSVNNLISGYNQIVNHRNKLLVSSTDQSPIIIQLNNQIRNSKAAIIMGINRYTEGLKVSLNRYEQNQEQTKGIVSAFPSKENELRSYARSFNFVEQLYLLLLQRKEEASISYISALPNIKVLSFGISSNEPKSPKTQFIYMSALLIGIIFPLAILYIMKILDTKINIREDLELVLPEIPFLGEIPYDNSFKTNIIDKRGIISESSRVIRSNLSYMHKDQDSHIITVTSTIKGEGKSFISFNIAESYRSLGKKVILLGGDLRNPQLHKFIGIERTNLGLSSFLMDNKIKLSDIIIKEKKDNPIHYLLSGSIPPNPSELLLNDNLKILLEKLKQSYDYIIIDSAPLMLVSDTNALLPLSDIVMYASRSQYSDKNLLPFIKKLKADNKFPSIGMVLNGLLIGPESYGYGYKYSYRYNYNYRYSYSYKYNYGYGYGYSKD